MKKTAALKNAYAAFDRLIELATLLVPTHPMWVVAAMHEYFRTLYPDDPYIPARYADDPLENVRACLETCLQMLEAAGRTGSYFTQGGAVARSQIDDTQAVFARLWRERLQEGRLDSTTVLRESFLRNGFDPAYFAGKTVVDVGCGSGRFTLGFAALGAALAVGVDLGGDGLAIGHAAARERRLDAATFVRASVLALPFADASFDFAYCKGVLHHTGALERGLDELHRVVKPEGKAFLYLYGTGGLFWYSRTRMREVMQRIPIDYTIQVLRLLGMPASRTIFVDSWYVPVEEHVDPEALERILARQGYRRVDRWTRGRSVELESLVCAGAPNARELWGEGELRYLLHK